MRQPDQVRPDGLSFLWKKNGHGFRIIFVCLWQPHIDDIPPQSEME